MRRPRVRRRVWWLLLAVASVLVLMAGVAAVSPWVPVRPGPPRPLLEAAKAGIRDAVVALHPGLRRRRDALLRQMIAKARAEAEAREKARGSPTRVAPGPTPPAAEDIAGTTRRATRYTDPLPAPGDEGADRQRTTDPPQLDPAPAVQP